MNENSPQKNKSPIRVTFFGDSIFVGQGVSIYRGWVTQVAKFLDDYGKTIGRQILVTNSSVNGRTTRQALEDMPYHVQSQGADILIVQFGLNDCNYWASDRGLPRVSIESFVANLNEIIVRGKNFGAKYVLLNSNHPTSRNVEPIPYAGITYEQSNIQYNMAIRTLAERLDRNTIFFQDIEKHFTNLIYEGARAEDFLLDDGLHLGDEGHAVYFEILCPRIKQAIDCYLMD